MRRMDTRILLLLFGLTCLDTLPAAGQWQVQTSVDRFTGERSVWAVGRGREDRSGPAEQVAIGLQCDSRGAVLFLRTPGIVLSVGGHREATLFRTDTAEVHSLDLTMSPGGTEAHQEAKNLHGAELENFWRLVSEMVSGDTLWVRAHDAQGIQHDMSFSLTGLRAARTALECLSPDSLSAGMQRAHDEQNPPEMTTPPRILNSEEVADAMKARYPPLLRSAGIGGTVTVAFLVSASGVVVSKQIVSSSGHADLDAVALGLADVIKFSPGEGRNGPMEGWVSFPITFMVHHGH